MIVRKGEAYQDTSSIGILCIGASNSPAKHLCTKTFFFDRVEIDDVVKMNLGISKTLLAWNTFAFEKTNEQRRERDRRISQCIL